MKSSHTLSKGDATARIKLDTTGSGFQGAPQLERYFGDFQSATKKRENMKVLLLLYLLKNLKKKILLKVKTKPEHQLHPRRKSLLEIDYLFMTVL